MEVLINEIRQEGLNIIVFFSSNFGDAKGFWIGENPKINEFYQVEVDINDKLIWNQNIIKNIEHNYSVHLINNLICISGLLDSLDNDGYAVLRIGDNIVPFIATGKPFKIGSMIKLFTKSISMSPIDY